MEMLKENMVSYSIIPIDSRLARRGGRSRRGATIALLCVLFPVVLAIASYAINVVYMELARTELQITTDIATRAAGRVLAVTGDQQQSINAADKFLKLNPFANKTMPLSGSDLVFGISTRKSESEKYQFVAGKNPNAVQIKTNGKVSVPMLFPTMGVPINFRPMKASISTQMVLDIALVIDRSGSMAYAASEKCGNFNPAAAPLGWKFGNPVPPNSRWLDASTAVDHFLQIIKKTGLEEHVSLSTYSSTQTADVGLTNLYAEISNKIDAFSMKFDGGATNIGGGILAGISTLADKKKSRPWATRVMIVLTDGIHNTGTDPIYAAKLAASQGIQIFTVSFSVEADIAKMEEVAATASGKHFHAVSGLELAEAFEEIAHSLPTLITF